MSTIVPADEIEQIVGTTRHKSQHMARAVSDERTVYILHSRMCKESGIDLRECPFSIALDVGIDETYWQDFMDMPVQVVVRDERLYPFLLDLA